MRCVSLLLCALLLGACATYEGTFEGDHVRVHASSDGPSFSATGTNMTGTITKDGTRLVGTDTPITGTVTWTKGKGWSVERR